MHVRTSYKADEVKWGAKFVNISDRDNADGIIRVDVTRLDEIEPAALPAGSLSSASNAIYASAISGGIGAGIGAAIDASILRKKTVLFRAAVPRVAVAP